MKHDVLKALVASDATDTAAAVGMVEINSELLTQVSGGMAHSSGAICTLSAECNGGGGSCWPRMPWASDQ